MRGILPMYSCCLRALARQATSQKHIVEAQAGASEAGDILKKAFTSQKSHRQFHSASAQRHSTSEASTSSVPTPSSFPVPGPRATSSSSSNNNGVSPMHFQPSPEQVTSHLNTLLEGLQPALSPELAMRMVTHKGSSSSTTTSPQHNAKLSLIGMPSFYCDLASRFLADLRLRVLPSRPSSPTAVPGSFPTRTQFPSESHRFYHE